MHYATGQALEEPTSGSVEVVIEIIVGLKVKGKVNWFWLIERVIDSTLPLQQSVDGNKRESDQLDHLQLI